MSDYPGPPSYAPPPPPPFAPPPPAPDPLRRRSGVLALAGVGLAAAFTIAAVLGSRHNSSVPASDVPGITQTPAPGACVTQAQARSIWNDVTQRLDDLALHPDTSKIDAVAQGTAADGLRTYLQDTLISKHLTERERERLDDLTVVQPGCNGQPLTVRITMTLVQDDYLAPDGHVDHRDSGVGGTTHTLESYVRSGSTWKVITIAPLDAPTQDQGNTV